MALPQRLNNFLRDLFINLIIGAILPSGCSTKWLKGIYRYLHNSLARLRRTLSQAEWASSVLGPQPEGTRARVHARRGQGLGSHDQERRPSDDAGQRGRQQPRPHLPPRPRPLRAWGHRPQSRGHKGQEVTNVAQSLLNKLWMEWSWKPTAILQSVVLNHVYVDVWYKLLLSVSLSR